MCLILFAYQQHRDFPLIVIANRDEYYARPTRDAHWWDNEDILAGRDLEAGGTWLGVNRRGDFAAVTNVREPGGMSPGSKSRGDLTRQYLQGAHDPLEYLQQLSAKDLDYSGFNLLLGDASALCYYSNRDREIRCLEPGIYGVSNGRFDEPWPKLASGKQALASILGDEIDSAGLMDILTDHHRPDDQDLPSTGVPLDVERLLSSRFIRSADYGTRASTVVIYDADDRIHFLEQNFINAEETGARVRESFSIRGDSTGG